MHLGGSSRRQERRCLLTPTTLTTSQIELRPPSSTCLHSSSNPNILNESAISTRAPYPYLLLDIPGISGGHFYASNVCGARHAVTICEVLHALHVKLSEQASQGNYNRLRSENHRRVASVSFSPRKRAVSDPVGLQGFDLLGGHTTFGLMESRIAPLQTIPSTPSYPRLSNSADSCSEGSLVANHTHC